MNQDPPRTPPRGPPRARPFDPPPAPNPWFRNRRPRAINIPPVNVAALFRNDPPVMNFRRRPMVVPPTESYSNYIHYGDRNIPVGSENAITYDDIENGANMVNFHGELARQNEPRYYTYNTFRGLRTNDRGFRLNPFTRQRIYPHEVEAYTARIPVAAPVPAPNNNVRLAGVKRTRNGSPRGGKRSIRRRRSTRRNRRSTRRT
jgi:hypothetical protein